MGNKEDTFFTQYSNAPTALYAFFTVTAELNLLLFKLKLFIRDFLCMTTPTTGLGMYLCPCYSYQQASKTPENYLFGSKDWMERKQNLARQVVNSVLKFVSFQCTNGAAERFLHSEGKVRNPWTGCTPVNCSTGDRLSAWRRMTLTWWQCKDISLCPVPEAKSTFPESRTILLGREL